jgi:hypothetical protein
MPVKRKAAPPKHDRNRETNERYERYEALAAAQDQLLQIVAILNRHGITPDGNDIAAGVRLLAAKRKAGA